MDTEVVPYPGYCNAAMDKSVYTSFQSSAFVFFKSRIARSHGSSFLIFWGISILFSTVAPPSYIPNKSAQGFPFLQIPANTS